MRGVEIRSVLILILIVIVLIPALVLLQILRALVLSGDPTKGITKLCCVSSVKLV